MLFMHPRHQRKVSIPSMLESFFFPKHPFSFNHPSFANEGACGLKKSIKSTMGRTHIYRATVQTDKAMRHIQRRMVRVPSLIPFNMLFVTYPFGMFNENLIKRISKFLNGRCSLQELLLEAFAIGCTTTYDSPDLSVPCTIQEAVDTICSTGVVNSCPSFDSS